MTSFTNLNLNPKILAALEKKGYTTPTPIQAQAIPHLLEGKDLLGIAQTGTGKTAAFSLPILHNLAKSNVAVKSGQVRTLILTPTRELASQIADNIELYGHDLGLRYAVIFGGVSERPQIATMQKGVDILIATPGRLLDLISQGHVRFMHLEILVLDEADRMLDMGFINDVKKIIAKIPEKRQTLFFSATMPETIADLAHSILKNPIKVEVTPQSTTVERIDQKIYQVAKGNKSSLLKRILKQEDATSVLVFSKTKHGANRVVEFLEKSGITVAAIHGNKSQGAREKALTNFRDGSVHVLVATDIAARGIDIPAISHVINFDVPMDPESYVHRIGRTARAGRQGVAITFCDPSETKLLQAVEKTIRFKIPVDTTHAFHGVEASPDNSDKREERPRVFNGRGKRPNHSASSSSRSSRPNSDRKSPRRGSSTPRATEEKSSILGFMGFGKKSDDRRPVREGNFDRAPRAPREDSRRSDDKKGGFGFGSWFKKPTDGRSEDRPRSRETRDDSFGNRERPAGSRERKPFNDRRERPSGDRREGSFGGERREGSSFGNRSGSRERKPFNAFNDRRERPAFGQGSSDRIEGGERREISGNREGASFGRSARTAFTEERPARPRRDFGGDRREGSASGDRRERPSFNGNRERPAFGGNGNSRRTPTGRAPSPKKRWQ